MKNNRLSKDKEFKLLYDVIVNDNKENFTVKYYNLIYHYVKKTILSKKFTKIYEEDYYMELTHIVFIKFFENNCHKLKQYNPDLGSLSGWIILLTIRFVLDELKKKDIPISYEDKLLTIKDPKNLQKTVEYKIDKHNVLSIAKKKLSKRAYNVLKLSLEGYTIAEISEKLNEKPSNCSLLKSRALSILIKLIQKMD